ncbi:MAG: hypothetical protein ABJM29_16580 [Rhizobiaceae bacterium]
MRKPLSIIVAACFLLISTLANFSTSYATTTEAPSTEIVVEASAHSQIVHDSIEPTSVDENQTAEQKDDCPCKSHHGAAKFLCGVTLALLDDASAMDIPAPTKTGYMLIKSAAVPSFVDRLKRPPRTLL